MATTKRLIRTAATPSTKVTIDTGEGLTKQNHKAECDVNLILAKYQKTGIIEHRVEHEARYDDADGIDFQTAMNLVKSAEAMFADLPSTVRKKFANDPSEFMNFVNDPVNIPEMIEMGLAVDTTPEPQEPIPVIVQTPSETPPEPTQA